MGTLSVTQPRENDRTTYVRQFTFNKVGEYNSRRDGAIVSGVPKSSTLLSNVPVGTIVNVLENSTPTRFIVVQHGYPTADNGRTLLLRETLYDGRAWGANDSSGFASSSIYSWLNSSYLGLIDTSISPYITKVPISCTVRKGSTSLTTVNAKVFLLSYTELCFSGASDANVEGSPLEYFYSNSKVAYDPSGRAKFWWTRTPDSKDSDGSVWAVSYSGSAYSGTFPMNYGNYSRPAFTLPDTITLSSEPNPDGSYDIDI